MVRNGQNRAKVDRSLAAASTVGVPAAPASSTHDIQPKTRAILYCRSPHTPCGSTLHQVLVRIASRMSKTLVPNAGHKRWPHSLATMTPPMTHHHPSESNPRPLEHETVARTAPLSLDLAAASRPGTLCAIALRCSCRSLGGENPGFEPGNFLFLCVWMLFVLCSWKSFM